ncbi:hypothetical protein MMYC01_208123 [Madurella mycetomatis]|uniref:DUF7907 domain-containing protein n=1 Tax=Madurella mycetomatis TaxID=100816 RepID=A0A175VV32_9PEZI|nr:hypothetical protein MMYC01_208123 [Madurella mycetomatis]
MHFTTATALLSIAAFAAAAPVDIDSYPPTVNSKAFRLVVNVTDPSRDLSPPVHGTEIFPYFINSSLIRAGVAQAGAGSVFLQFPDPNPSSPKFAPFGGQLLTEQGGPDNVLGLNQISHPDDTPFPDNDPRYAMSFTPGKGTMGIQLAVGGHYAFVRPSEFSGGLGNFAICRIDLGQRDHHGHERWMQALDSISLSTDENGEFGLHIPEGCTHVRLVAQCDVLKEVPEGSAAWPFHQAAQEVRCYEDVMAIDWSQYEFSL